jgi:hypothetical protein
MGKNKKIKQFKKIRVSNAEKMRRLPLILNLFRFFNNLFHKLNGSIKNFYRTSPLNGYLFPKLPKTFFSGSAKNSAFNMVLVDQGNIELPIDSISEKSGLYQNKYQPWKIFWTKMGETQLHGASLCPIDKKGHIMLEAAYYEKAYQDDPAWNTLIRHPTIFLEGNWTSLVSRWVPTNAPTNYAHWLFDALPRLALISNFPSDTRIIVPESLSAFQKDTLAILNLSNRCLKAPSQSIVCENFYFSSPTSMIVCWNPYAIKFLRESFLTKKLFVKNVLYILLEIVCFAILPIKIK